MTTFLIALALASPAQAMVPPAGAVGVPPRSSITTFSTASGDGLGLSLLSRRNARSSLGSGTRGAPNPDGQRSETIRSVLLLDYRLFPRLTFIAALPHVYHASASSQLRQTTNALGDAAIYGKYALLQDHPRNPRNQLSAILGVKYPTGSTSLRDAGGRRLPMPQQAGTGTIDFIFGAAASLTFPRGSLYGDVSYKFNTKAAYTFGDFLSANLGFNLPIGPIDPLSLTAELNGELAARDHSKENGAGVLPGGAVRDTGSELLFVSPGLQWRLARRSAASLSVQFPVYENYRGTQLRAGPTASLGLYTRF